MPITINGTTGVAGVDGTAGTPAMQGTDTNTGIYYGSDTVNVSTGGALRASFGNSGLTLIDYTETYYNIGTVTSTVTLNLANGTFQNLTLTSATALTVTMPTATAGKSFILIVRQPASGTATTATFTGVKWPGSTAPTITATVGRADILVFFADGTNWYGSFVQNYTP